MPRDRIRLLTATLLAAQLAACGGPAPTTGTAQPSDQILEIPITTAPGVAWMGGETVLLASGVAVRTGEPTVVIPAATTPGQLTGATVVRFAVTITNGRAEPVDVSGAVVRATVGGTRAPAALVASAGPDPAPGFRGIIEPGHGQTVTLTFRSTTRDRSLIEVSVAPGPRLGSALFQGSVD